MNYRMGNVPRFVGGGDLGVPVSSSLFVFAELVKGSHLVHSAETRMIPLRLGVDIKVGEGCSRHVRRTLAW